MNSRLIGLVLGMFALTGFAGISGPISPPLSSTNTVLNGATNVSLGGTFTGNGYGLTNLNATNIVGILPAGALGTGTVRTVGGIITTGQVQAATISGLYQPTWTITTNTLGPINPASSQYYACQTSSNMTVTVSMTGGSIVPLVAVRNVGTQSVNVIFSDSKIKWTGGAMTNAIATNTMTTFGFWCSSLSGNTNGYATQPSSN